LSASRLSQRKQPSHPSSSPAPRLAAQACSSSGSPHSRAHARLPPAARRRRKAASADLEPGRETRCTLLPQAQPPSLQQPGRRPTAPLQPSALRSPPPAPTRRAPAPRCAARPARQPAQARARSAKSFRRSGTAGTRTPRSSSLALITAKQRTASAASASASLSSLLHASSGTNPPRSEDALVPKKSMLPATTAGLLSRPARSTLRVSLPPALSEVIASSISGATETRQSGSRREHTCCVAAHNRLGRDIRCRGRPEYASPRVCCAVCGCAWAACARPPRWRHGVAQPSGPYAGLSEHRHGRLPPEAVSALPSSQLPAAPKKLSLQ